MQQEDGKQQRRSVTWASEGSGRSLHSLNIPHVCDTHCGPGKGAKGLDVPLWRPHDSTMNRNHHRSRFLAGKLLAER